MQLLALDITDYLIYHFIFLLSCFVMSKNSSTVLFVFLRSDAPRTKSTVFATVVVILSAAVTAVPPAVNPMLAPNVKGYFSNYHSTANYGSCTTTDCSNVIAFMFVVNILLNCF